MGWSARCGVRTIDANPVQHLTCPQGRLNAAILDADSRACRGGAGREHKACVAGWSRNTCLKRRPFDPIRPNPTPTVHVPSKSRPTSTLHPRKRLARTLRASAQCVSASTLMPVAMTPRASKSRLSRGGIANFVIFAQRRFLSARAPRACVGSRAADFRNEARRRALSC
jgi:hypothetical protein